VRAERLPELRTASSRRCRRRLVGAGGAGQTLSRVQLLDAAWDIAFESHSNVLMSTSATCGRRSTGPSGATRWRRSAVLATDSASMTRDERCSVAGASDRRGRASRSGPDADERPSDPDTADASLRACDGGCADGSGRVRLHPCGLGAAPVDRPGPARAGNRGDVAGREREVARRPGRDGWGGDAHGGDLRGRFDRDLCPARAAVCAQAGRGAQGSRGARFEWDDAHPRPRRPLAAARDLGQCGPASRRAGARRIAAGSGRDAR